MEATINNLQTPRTASMTQSVIEECLIVCLPHSTHHPFDFTLDFMFALPIALPVFDLWPLDTAINRIRIDVSVDFNGEAKTDVYYMDKEKHRYKGFDVSQRQLSTMMDLFDERLKKGNIDHVYFRYLYQGIIGRFAKTA